MKLRKWAALLLVVVSVLLLFTGCFQMQGPDEPYSDPYTQAATVAPTQTKAPTQEAPADTRTTSPPEATLDEDGSYTSKEDVALYIHLYGHLPQNFITKKQAQSLGWSGGSLEKYAPGKSKRGAKRIVFSNDGLVYYTADHYASFTLLYGEE